MQTHFEKTICHRKMKQNIKQLISVWRITENYFGSRGLNLKTLFYTFCRFNMISKKKFVVYNVSFDNGFQVENEIFLHRIGCFK